MNFGDDCKCAIAEVIVNRSSEVTATECLVAFVYLGTMFVDLARDLGGESFLRAQREKRGLDGGDPAISDAVYRAVDAMLEIVDLERTGEVAQ